MESDYTSFNILLSNRQSIDKYPTNSISQFVNTIHPPIKFKNSQNWEVGIQSVLLPYKWISSDIISIPEKASFTFEIIKLKQSTNSNIPTTHPNVINVGTGTLADKALYLIKIDTDELIGLSSIQIYNKIIQTIIKTEKASNKLPKIGIKLLKQLFTYGFQKILLANRIHNKISNIGVYKDLIKLNFYPDTFTKNILGLSENVYTLFDINDDLESSQKDKYIAGNKNIDLNFNITNYIYIYSDIIKAIRYGSQFIQILDVLPLGKNFDIIERKLTNIIYHTVALDSINEIAIKITDSSHELLVNFAEEMIINLHFRKKL